MQVMICLYLVFLGVPVVCVVTYCLAALVGKALSFSGEESDTLLDVQVRPPLPFGDEPASVPAAAPPPLPHGAAPVTAHVSVQDDDGSGGCLARCSCPQRCLPVLRWLPRIPAFDALFLTRVDDVWERVEEYMTKRQEDFSDEDSNRSGSCVHMRARPLVCAHACVCMCVQLCVRLDAGVYVGVCECV